MDIYINVDHQKITIDSINDITSVRNIAPGTQNFIRFNFNLSDDWKGLTVFAQFRQNGNAYNQYLDKNRKVYLPTEITNGDCTVMLYGSYEDVIATTKPLKLFISEDILIQNAQSTVISTSLYNQLVTMVSDLTDRVTALERIHNRNT